MDRANLKRGDMSQCEVEEASEILVRIPPGLGRCILQELTLYTLPTAFAQEGQAYLEPKHELPDVTSRIPCHGHEFNDQ